MHCLGMDNYIKIPKTQSLFALQCYHLTDTICDWLIFKESSALLPYWSLTVFRGYDQLIPSSAAIVCAVFGVQFCKLYELYVSLEECVIKKDRGRW